jgi:DNA (cytosine-5)-methyltransferase 1
MRSIEICAGAGGQALGLEQAGFDHLALVEMDQHACATLRANRPRWNVIEGDVKSFSASACQDIDLFAGGVPCPPFSVAGMQLGGADDRDLFPEALRLIQECQPKAVMLENVRGIFDSKFDDYRQSIIKKLETMNYACDWRLINASHYGVPQHRPRAILIALKQPYAKHFAWPLGVAAPPPTVGQLLFEEMASNGWAGAAAWRNQANGIAPTVVVGSKKHGGADLGPTRAKQAWEKLGVNGKGLADEPPAADFAGNPKLTVKMAALVQGFPPEWQFTGKKTPAYRQVGNAFPPPAARAIGISLMKALAAVKQEQEIAQDEKVRVTG